MKLKPEHKPMAPSILDYVERTRKEKYGDKVKTQWRVEEWRPAYTESGYYGEDYPAKLVSYSEWFDTKEDAEAYMAKHEPERGNELKLKSRSLYRKYIPAHWQERWI